MIRRTILVAVTLSCFGRTKRPLWGWINSAASLMAWGFGSAVMSSK